MKECRNRGYDFEVVDFLGLANDPEELSRNLRNRERIFMDKRLNTDYLLISSGAIGAGWNREYEIRFYEIVVHCVPKQGLNSEITPEMEQRLVDWFDSMRKLGKSDLSGKDLLEFITDWAVVTDGFWQNSQDRFQNLTEKAPFLKEHISSGGLMSAALEDLVNMKLYLWLAKFSDYKIYPPLQMALERRFDRVRGGGVAAKYYRKRLDEYYKNGENSWGGVQYPCEYTIPKMLYLMAKLGEANEVFTILEKMKSDFLPGYDGRDTLQMMQPILIKLATLSSSNPELSNVLGNKLTTDLRNYAVANLQQR